jgi:hypothetical protein
LLDLGADANKNTIMITIGQAFLMCGIPIMNLTEEFLIKCPGLPWGWPLAD